MSIVKSENDEFFSSLPIVQPVGHTSQNVFGFDMGIDSNGKVWIIEANLRPDITLFLKLKDKGMYLTIVSYR
ncbi:YheC/YheD family protein [Brevibacillus nitrificans]|uniref:YheC/YheD family protein n=1 Tax=Brevibacillus nitrificans TaxID=651560 RepID=UPI0028655DF8|nr:YheC/YheD family protein [Brevibacillus nitrificans]MDR7314316.1 hypothetical protein [Brevibacillus nitrificans]